VDPVTASPDPQKSPDARTAPEETAPDLAHSRDAGSTDLSSEADEPAAKDTGEAFPFLAPARGPGELGWLGPYRVLVELGAGGMGLVFQAEDSHLKRRVALKTLRPALAASATARQRFLREAQTMASLEHDHIVQVYQVGEDRDVPFLAMQLLKGETLARRLHREGKLSADEVLRIGREAAEGLAAAHAAGLIHRDVKPGNIWLEAERGRVKILDFGLARAAETSVHLTQSGFLPGTPAYMAPEQAQGEPVDARCDLFSLGCVLYRACTGKHPFKGTTHTAVLLSVVQDQPAPPRALNPEVPPELSDLIMRLLAKSPAERPASARAVVDAISGIERDRTVLLSGLIGGTERGATASGQLPPSAGQGAGRSRRWWPLAIASVLFAGLLLWGATVVLKGRHGTLTVTTSEPDVKVFVDGEEKIVIDSKKAGKVELTPGEHRLSVRRGAEELFTDTFTVKNGGEVIIKARWEPRVAERPPAPASTPTPPTGSVFDTLRRQDVPAHELTVAGDGDPKKAPVQLVAVLGNSRLKHGGMVRSVDFSRDGQTLITSSSDGTLKFWSVATGEAVRSLRLGVSEFWSSALSPDGKTLAVSVSYPASVKRIDVDSGKERQTLVGQNSHARFVTFSPDGKYVAATDYGGREADTVKVWEADSGKLLHTLNHPSAYCVAFSRDGKMLASSSNGKEGTVKLWDAGTGSERRTWKVQPDERPAVAFSPDGKTLASGSGRAHSILLWDVETGKELHTLEGAGRGVSSLAFSPDGTRLATGRYDNLLQVWDVGTGKELWSVPVLRGGAACVAFSRDGKTLAAGCGDWRGGVRIDLWNADTGEPLHRLTGHQDAVDIVAVRPDGKVLASAGADGVKLWDVATRKELHALPQAAAPAFSPDGKYLVTLWRREMKLWDSATWKELRSWSYPERTILECVTFGPDSKWLAVGSRNAWVKVWDVASWKEVRTLHGLQGEVWSVAFSPDGRTLATGEGGATGTVKLWEAATGKFVRVLPSTKEAISCVIFSPDGQTLAAAHANGLKLWDVGSGRELRSLPTPRASGRFVVFTPDGKGLVSAGGVLRFWDLHALRAEVADRTLTGAVNRVAYSPDGRHLITANNNGTLYVLRLGPPEAAPGK
jgi:WD40 repeat protein/tRNA A-37 threonylcarbamoyl transferase component Bud32